jgi:hypothetical protein
MRYFLLIFLINSAFSSIKIIEENRNEFPEHEKKVVEIFSNGNIRFSSSGFFDHHVNSCRDIGGIVSIKNTALAENSIAQINKLEKGDLLDSITIKTENDLRVVKKNKLLSNMLNKLKQQALSGEAYSLVKLNAALLDDINILVTLQFAGSYPFGIWLPEDINRLFYLKGKTLKHFPSNIIGSQFLDSSKNTIKLKLKASGKIKRGELLLMNNMLTRHKNVSGGIVRAVSPQVSLCAEIIK